MNQSLAEAIAGEPITVKLGKGSKREEYPLAFPIQAVILYKRETARIDRERAKDRPRLSLEERHALRDRRRDLLLEADKLRVPQNEKWESKFLKFDALMDEASTLKVILDEDAGQGDSLYDMYNWRKISIQEDPERVLLALWVGLHIFEGKCTSGPAERAYMPRMSMVELAELVDLSNGQELTLAISKALAGHLVARAESVPEEERPKAESEAGANRPPIGVTL